jgi:uncharacterized protein with beta-barrel porin domain
VTIASGTTTLGSAERLLDTAAVTVNSNLVLGGAEKIGSLFGTGNVDLTAGALTVDSGNFSGVLKSGNSTYGLTKITSGALTLAGANTYTAATHVNGGTLNLTGSLASTTVNVSGGTILNDTNSGLAANAALFNAGTVNLGANDTIASLSNTGTINGAGKTLTAATYALNNGSVINANLGTGSVTTSGVVNLNGTSNASNISIPFGSTLNLGGTGPLLINPAVAVGVNGTMNLIGGDESIQALSGAGVINLNVHQLNVVNGGLFTGTINGTGAQLNSNGGVLSLANGSTSTQSTNVGSGGTINVTGTANVSTQNTNVAGGGTLNVGAGGAFNATAAGGTGNINLANNASVTLAPGAILNYVLLNGGTADSPGGTVNSANFTNDLGETVGGFLTFSGNFVNNGILSPGNSPGLTTILGNYTQNATLQAQLETTTPISGYDQVRVSGTVTLNPTSTLVVQAIGGTEPVSGNVYQIIANSTGGAIAVNGAFGNVLFNTNTSPNAAAVFDVATGRLLTTGLNASNSVFADLGATSNQRVAANALMTAAMSGVGTDQINSATAVGSSAYALLSANGATSSANAARLVPEHYSGIANFGLLTSQAVSDFLFVRSTSIGKSSGLAVGDSVDDKSIYVGYMNNRDNTTSSNVERKDSYIGAEGGSGPLTMGVLVMSSTGAISSTYGGGSVRGQGATIYGRFAVSPALSILGSIGYSSQNFTLNRTSVTGVAQATTSAHGMNASLGASYLAYQMDELSILPRVSLNYADTVVDGFAETGSAQRLNIGGYKASRTDFHAGMLLARNTNLDGHAVKLALSAGVDSTIGSDQGNMDAIMATSPEVQFPIGFASDRKTSGTLGLSANYELSKTASMYVKYDYHSSGNSARVELNKSF